MKTDLKKGSWSVEEDQKLISYINKYGIWNWSLMPKYAGLSRTGKSCRLRWMNYLKPNLKRGEFSKEEDESILHLHSLLGNKWSAIASRLPGRTDNDIKNYWHSHLKKYASEQNRACQTTEFRAAYSDTSSPESSDDLQCFWDQLCPFENLELRNTNLLMDVLPDHVFKDSDDDVLSSYALSHNDDYNSGLLLDS